jgi:hypothetical protein
MFIKFVCIGSQCLSTEHTRVLMSAWTQLIAVLSMTIWCHHLMHQHIAGGSPYPLDELGRSIATAATISIQNKQVHGYPLQYTTCEKSL